MPVKYVFVTGGVVSGLGKGITAASLGRLLKSRGYKVTMQKFDPYINIDPGTMNPVQHGEVFVTDDGAETDLDLGHYERFIDESLTKNSNVTTGKIYWSVLQKERRGDFGGGTVQVIPHITNEIKSRFHRNYSTTETEIAIIEVGGTVGDIESQPFLEAIRQFQLLSEMDGFDTSKGLFILAATNRPEVLDKALLRPGRFDRRIIVNKPDLKGRLDVLKVHSRNVAMDETVNLNEIALATSGAVG